MDRDIGRLLALLEALGPADDTLVMFTSDNGATFDIGGYDPEFFEGTGPLRGCKTNLYEGGIRSRSEFHGKPFACIAELTLLGQ